MAVIRIDVISDVVCVWCYVGKRTLDRAISIYQNGPDSVEKTEIMKRKFVDKTPEQVDRMTKRMNQIGDSVGIKLRYGGKIGHTRNAHRLIHYSQHGSAQCQNAVVEDLFRAYHELEQDITKLEVLCEIAEDAGLDKSRVKSYLESDQDVELLDEEAQANRANVTSGVPTFLIQGEHRVDGAQDLQEFVEAFIKVKESGSQKSVIA